MQFETLGRGRGSAWAKTFAHVPHTPVTTRLETTSAGIKSAQLSIRVHRPTGRIMVTACSYPDLSTHCPDGGVVYPANAGGYRCVSAAATGVRAGRPARVTAAYALL
ncbi:hypothetical protein KCP76_22720 [Salmonella enterica subsp. enterica serovar Weltevreden]|nr:hypothetical protein KCP76_22720 [Salmonella enterica subsp. enterica serovar Weltevreden]